MSANGNTRSKGDLRREIRRLEKELATIKFRLTFREAIATTTLDALVKSCRGSSGVITVRQKTVYDIRRKELNEWVHAMWPGAKKPANGNSLKYPWDKTNPIYINAKKHLQAIESSKRENLIFTNDATKDLENYIHLVDQRQNRPNVAHDPQRRRSNPLPSAKNTKSANKK
jgi:hypothetical protein